MADLELLPSGRYGIGQAVNDDGVVVGASECADRSNHAALWRQGRISDLGTLGGSDSAASDVNRDGVVVGFSETRPGDTERHAFICENGRMTDLGTLGGSSSSADAINDRGWVVGYSETAEGAMHAFLWRDGEMTDLGTLTQGAHQSSRAYDIDNQGRIVGQASMDATNAFPVMWEDGRIRRLTDRTGCVASINSRGQVAGGLSSGSESFLWTRDDVTVIGPVNDETYLQASGVDRGGRVVGSTGFRAFVWHRGDFDWLPGLSTGSTSAKDISDDGRFIVGGSSSTPDGLTPHPVTWTRQ